MILERPQNRDLIDLVRALAILQVILFHVFLGFGRVVEPSVLQAFIPSVPGILNFAWQAMGVDLIFMISAFLLSMSLFQEIEDTGRVSYRAHLVKRMSRVLPLYYVALAAFAFGQGDSAADIIRSIFFVGFVFSDYNVIPVGWSMEVLIWVYLALPFVILALSRAKRPVLSLVLVGLASVIIRHVFLIIHPVGGADLYTQFYTTGSFHPAMKEIYYRVPFRLTPFIVGIGLALMARKIPPQSGRPLPVALGLTLFAIMFWWPVHDPGQALFRKMGEVGWQIYWAYSGAIGSFGVALALYGSFGRRGEHHVPLHRLWNLISRNIFAVYLFHMPFILVAAILVFRSTNAAALDGMTIGHALTIFGFASAMALGFSVILTRIIERPIQNWLRRHFLPTS